MRSLLKNAFMILSALVVVLTLLAYLCPHVNPATFSWLTFFGTAFPWILLANIAMIILWAWRRNRFALYHLGILILGWQYITGFIGFDFGKDAVPEGAVVVATHNIGGLFRGVRITDSLRERVATQYAAFIRDSGKPDILCTQETNSKFYHFLTRKMGYPYTFNLKKGTVIFSRYPIEGGGEVPFGKTANSSLWADIRIGKKTIRLYNVHLQSNKVAVATEKVIGGAELNEEETWHEIGSVLHQVGNATGIRAEQAQRLREHLEASPHPVVVCGDFNDTPNSYVYAQISEGLSDTFRDKGLGLGTSFAGALPLLRIDYILTEKKFTTFSCRTVRGTFSDHYPVFASIGI
ncbi:MAG: endonuclease/exonuclease/phosphatase family protein [Lewinellaceae bacterium]|nr:endonuclease/exonuclease/phosphatase family protein [Saprospiraceae bacterium]MCB9355153.1 endonuclease/exonuclease/phosphatase family protein [Lewinellaceae bacterium]